MPPSSKIVAKSPEAIFQSLETEPWLKGGGDGYLYLNREWLKSALASVVVYAAEEAKVTSQNKKLDGGADSYSAYDEGAEDYHSSLLALAEQIAK